MLVWLNMIIWIIKNQVLYTDLDKYNSIDSNILKIGKLFFNMDSKIFKNI